jgi:hypothetical protein
VVHTLELRLLVDIGAVIGSDISDCPSGKEQLGNKYMVQIMAPMTRVHAFRDILSLATPLGLVIGMAPGDFVDQLVAEEGICDGQPTLHGQIDKTNTIRVCSRMAKSTKGSFSLGLISTDASIKVTHHPTAVLVGHGVT